MIKTASYFFCYSNKINPLLPQRRTPLSRSQSLRETKTVAKWRVPSSDTKDVISLVGDRSQIQISDAKRGNFDIVIYCIVILCQLYIYWPLSDFRFSFQGMNFGFEL